MKKKKKKRRSTRSSLLTRNMQEMRDQMAPHGSKGEKERERADMKSRGTVSFELEDFMECVHFKGNAAMLPSSSRNKEQPKEEKQRRLDLKLSL